MNEMVERVAQAIIVAGYNPATAENIARIAITAMREPTEAMKAVTSENTWHAVQDYQAMIDAALGN